MPPLFQTYLPEKTLALTDEDMQFLSFEQDRILTWRGH